MLEVIVCHNDIPIKTYEFEDDTITVGRLPENSIPIASISVSRRHLRIDRTGTDSYNLSDLKSLNGAYIDNQKISTIVLKGGETVSIGKYSLQFEIVTDDQNVSNTRFFSEPMEPLAKEASIAAEPVAQPAPEAAQINTEPDPITATPDQPAIIETEESADTKEKISTSSIIAPETPVFIDTNKHVIYKLEKDIMSVGNGDNDDIFVEGFMLSDGLFIIERSSEGTTISSSKKMSKFKVNGKKETRAVLSHKDRIEIGNTTFRYMESESN